MFAYFHAGGAQLYPAARLRRLIAALAAVTCGVLAWAASRPAPQQPSRSRAQAGPTGPSPPVARSG